ncbi:MAG TPA: hypothetical protein PK191_00980 [Niabella sp.]|nr:hypothetical protein [Niabella sp.]HOZ97660.1 hypothetical protein [Niabella sp.]HQW13966.1 hypothetical protein [Niabella sp.]HQX19491.1 hypothetical protein [Niabella sp.]HQX41452.1 hypothetical protein [Niabella sp.]
MFIKYLVLVLSGLMFSLFSKAQDNIFGYYEILVSSQIPVPNTPEALQQIHFSPSSNTGSFGSGSAVAGSTINYIGLNKNHYLFSIEPVSTDKFHVNSFNTQNIFLAKRVFTDVNWNGNLGTDARIKGMAIDNNQTAWVTAFSVVDGKNYLTTFKTNATGTGSDFLSKPFIFKTDLLSFEVKDLAFDLFGNMYALVLDAISGFQYIYHAHTKSLENKLPGEIIPLTLLWQITEAANNPIRFDPKYYNNSFPDFKSSIAEGLAFDSEGHLLISVDKMTFTNFQNGYRAKVTNMLYAYRPDDGDNLARVKLYDSPENNTMISYCDDLASNYFPAFIPTNFGEAKATLQNNKLKVTWATETERNNTKFDVSISANGTTFTNIGSLNSSANDGNSNQSLKYSFDFDISDSPALAFFSLWGLLFWASLSQGQRKSRLITCFSLVFIFFISCSKKNNGGGETNIYTGKVFVKITAIDKKSKTTDSKVILAVR